MSGRPQPYRPRYGRFFRSNAGVYPRSRRRTCPRRLSPSPARPERASPRHRVRGGRPRHPDSGPRRRERDTHLLLVEELLGGLEVTRFAGLVEEFLLLPATLVEELLVLVGRRERAVVHAARARPAGARRPRATPPSLDERPGPGDSTSVPSMRGTPPVTSSIRTMSCACCSAMTERRGRVGYHPPPIPPREDRHVECAPAVNGIPIGRTRSTWRMTIDPRCPIRSPPAPSLPRRRGSVPTRSNPLTTAGHECRRIRHGIGQSERRIPRFRRVTGLI